MNLNPGRDGGYDIIGDVHGEADALERLLGKLGYAPVDGCWQHSSRQVIFLGDFIDKGPQQKRVLEIVMPMVQEGHALARPRLRTRHQPEHRGLAQAGLAPEVATVWKVGPR